MENNIQLWILKDIEGLNIDIGKIIQSHFNNVSIRIFDTVQKIFENLTNESPDALLIDISDSNINSANVIQEIRKIDISENIYIVLVGQSKDYTSLINELDSGANDIILKPFTNESVVARVKTILKYIELIRSKNVEYNLLQELADQLEKTQNEEINLISKLYSTRLSISREIINLIEGASLWMINFLEYTTDEDLQDIEIAANLSLLGRIGLPDNLLNLPVYIDGKVSDPLMYQIPIVARNLLADIPRLYKVSEILFHIYENMDGTGFPDKLQSWQIPLKSRLLRVVLDYYDIRRYYNAKSSDALEILKKYANQLYDKRVVILFEQYILSILKLEGEIDEITVPLQNLQEGMQLSRDIYTNNGLKLLNAGNFLTDITIKKLIAHNTTDPILGLIYIKK